MNQSTVYDLIIPHSAEIQFGKCIVVKSGGGTGWKGGIKIAPYSILRIKASWSTAHTHTLAVNSSDENPHSLFQLNKASFVSVQPLL